MEPLPPLVPCSLQPMCVMGRCRNAQAQKGKQGDLMSGQGKVKWAVLGQEPWWALWASAADAYRPGEYQEMQQAKRNSSNGQVR